ncbi:MAG: flagellar assembly peptidoglycan hydrolase FlgJ [Candidatus Thiodiazotropha sp. (ex Epidulcina cf. delphinae)]|nr:flagellar assembly peptidoglycan hydrolase FlgJ [Candidatus Thiodiazotropha sp. (ex Epidulcina cf. delphinae)]
MNGVAPSLYHDFSGLAALKRQAREDQAGSAEQVARQFESLFVQMMVKQMRQAGFGGGIFDSQSTRFAQDMYDQQLSVHLSERRGIGMLQMLRSRLGRQAGEDEVERSGLADYRRHPTRMAGEYLPKGLKNPEALQDHGDASRLPTGEFNSPERFVQSLWSAAEQAATELGLPTEALLAQAALETGWGGQVMQGSDGRSSHNLFGIKADLRWQGERVRRETLEYQGDVAVRRRENFRTYTGFEESFQDYVAFLKGNPRYTEALRNTHDTTAYFKALQDAGYATDPDYAQKILRVMQGPEMETALARFKASAGRPIQSAREAI